MQNNETFDFIGSMNNNNNNNRKLTSFQNMRMKQSDRQRNLIKYWIFSLWAKNKHTRQFFLFVIALITCTDQHSVCIFLEQQSLENQNFNKRFFIALFCYILHLKITIWTSLIKAKDIFCFFSSPCHPNPIFHVNYNHWEIQCNL